MPPAPIIAVFLVCSLTAWAASSIFSRHNKSTPIDRMPGNSFMMLCGLILISFGFGGMIVFMFEPISEYGAGIVNIGLLSGKITGVLTSGFLSVAGVVAIAAARILKALRILGHRLPRDIP